MPVQVEVTARRVQMSVHDTPDGIFTQEGLFAVQEEEAATRSALQMLQQIAVPNESPPENGLGGYLRTV